MGINHKKLKLSVKVDVYTAPGWERYVNDVFKPVSFGTSLS